MLFRSSDIVRLSKRLVSEAERMATIVDDLLELSRIEFGGEALSSPVDLRDIAREAQLKRTTVDSYFEVLEETLIAYRLPALKLHLHSKELSHPKFYFFDAGVARASAGLIFEEVDSVWRGFALETWMLHELRAFNSYESRAKELFYYKATGGEFNAQAHG